MPRQETWLTIVAKALYESNVPLRNIQIERSEVVQQYIKKIGKRLRTLPGIVSKTLNTHSEEGISNDQSRREPFIFGKDGQGRWFLNEEGKRWLKL